MTPARFLPARPALFALLALGLPLPAAWAGQGWTTALRGSVIQDFHDEDLRQFMGAVRRLLDAPVSAEPAEWRNAESGAGAQLVVLGSPQIAGYGECRRVRVTAYSKKRKGQPTSWTACRLADGNWQLVR